MFDSVLQQFTGGGAGSMGSNELHQGLDALLGQSNGDQVSGAINDALGALGSQGFAHSVQTATQNHGPSERGQLGSLLLGAIEQGGGNPASVLGNLGIGTQNPQNMSHGDLGALAGYVAENHGGALAGLLGGGGSGGGVMSDALHLLGNPMVQHTAENLAQRFL
jgi:hypothetical protein